VINSVASLCRALSASLRADVLPHLHDGYARGQLAAAIYALHNLESQASWSEEELAQRADRSEAALAQARLGLERLGLPPRAAQLPVASSAAARRDAADAAICVLFDWLAERRAAGEMSAAMQAIERQLLDQAAEIVRHEKRLVPPSMMRELSGE
jgi:hypothetical protein